MSLIHHLSTVIDLSFMIVLGQATAVSLFPSFKLDLVFTSVFVRVRTSDLVCDHLSPQIIACRSTTSPFDAIERRRHPNPIHCFPGSFLLGPSAVGIIRNQSMPTWCRLHAELKSRLLRSQHPLEHERRVRPNKHDQHYTASPRDLSFCCIALRLYPLCKRARLHLSARRSLTHRFLPDQDGSRKQTAFATTRLFYEQPCG